MGVSETSGDGRSDQVNNSDTMNSGGIVADDEIVVGAPPLSRMIETTVMGYDKTGEFHASFLFVPAKLPPEAGIEDLLRFLGVTPVRSFVPDEYQVDNASPPYSRA
jgi:hypothetical protein